MEDTRLKRKQVLSPACAKWKQIRVNERADKRKARERLKFAKKVLEIE